jgi:1,4-alpha-glucan branching enzyme
MNTDLAAPSTTDLDLLARGEHHDPHSVLGAHPHRAGTIIRTLRPQAELVAARIGGVDYPLQHVANGLFSALVPIRDLADYRLVVTYPGAGPIVTPDGYRFLPTLGELDLHLFKEGRHERLWDILGAHVRSYTTPDGDVTGTSFAVWAPNARGVTVIGDFEYWAGDRTPMRALGSTGVWELFVPDVGEGTRYKFRIHGSDGVVRDKADPMALRTEIPPDTASVVTTSDYVWQDQDWLTKRAEIEPSTAPMSVYEVHLGSWRRGLDYRALAHELADYVNECGFTHVELLPIAEHPFGGSWGYQVTSYFAPTARFGRPDDFRYFVDHLHAAGISVLVDWVPAHFPKDAWALARFDGTALYEHADPRRGEQLDWGTYVFDFGRSEVRNFLVANALYWMDEFHIDGLRVDAVASMLYLDFSKEEGGWTPNIHGGRENLEAVAFLQEMNATVHKVHRGVATIAEESTDWPGVTRATSDGGLGFNMKWSMGWMHDTLDYFAHDPIHRSYHHNEITFSAMYAWSENYLLPISHDEVVHGKGTLWTRMPGGDYDKAAGLRSFLAYMWAHPGKQLLFMGQEFGQVREWSEERSLDWHLLDDDRHRGVFRLVTDLNNAYKARPALWNQDTSPEGYSWINADDRDDNVVSFLRFGSDGGVVACIYNLSGSLHATYRIGLPTAGRWIEVLNTDAQIYGGGGVGNFGAVTASHESRNGLPASAQIALAPLSAIWLVPDQG